MSLRSICFLAVLAAYGCQVASAVNEPSSSPSPATSPVIQPTPWPSPRPTSMGVYKKLESLEITKISAPGRVKAGVPFEFEVEYLGAECAPLRAAVEPYQVHGDDYHVGVIKSDGHSFTDAKLCRNPGSVTGTWILWTVGRARFYAVPPVGQTATAEVYVDIEVDP